MTSAVLVLAGFLAQATVDIAVAPDQPLPYVYVDDPLILELKSDQDVAANVTIEIAPEFASSAPSYSMDLGTVPLRANAPWWHPVENAPVERGRYRLVAHLNVHGITEDKAAFFSRIDRPLTDCSLPVAVAVEGLDSHSALALQGVFVHSVRMDVQPPEVTDRVKGAAAAGFRVVLGLDDRQYAQCETLSRDLIDCVAGWEIDAGDNTDTFASMRNALRRGGSRAPVMLVAQNPNVIGKMFNAPEPPHIDGVVYRATWPTLKNVLAIRAAMERSGQEGMPLVVAVAPETQDDIGVRVARQVLIDAAAGAERTEFDKDIVLGEELGPAYVQLSALAQLWHSMTYIGSLDVPPPATALVFRAADRWLVASWTDLASQEVSLKIGDGAVMALADGRDNPSPAPALKEGAVKLALIREPQFLSGKAGSIVASATCNMALREAVAFAESDEFHRRLPPEVIDTVRKIGSLDPGRYNRLDFLNLLKLFPYVEGLWRSGQVPGPVAAPALASLARLARWLCVLEQERGEPFVEPLQNTLALCGQFQSLYLTSSGNETVNERADWLMGELGRLTAEAERMATEGRVIEANAIAVIAEWRGRELEIAARGAAYRPTEVAQVQKQPAKEKTSTAAVPAVPKKSDRRDKTSQASDKKERPKAKKKNGKGK